MMEAGQLMTADVLPKLTKRMSEFARENGALGKSMQTVNAEQGRFQTALTGGKEALFKGGMGEGMAYFFRNTANLLNDIKPLLQWLGGFIKGVISTVTGLGKVLLLPLNLLSDIAEVLSPSGKIAAIAGGAGVLALVAGKFGLIAKAVGAVNTGLLLMMTRLIAIATPLLMLEDIYVGMKGGDSYAKDLTGVGTSQWWETNKYNPSMGAIGAKVLQAIEIKFNSDEAKKLFSIVQDENNKNQMSSLASELN
jgi:hypothetical protein